jgi:hypothetical protein
MVSRTDAALSVPWMPGFLLAASLAWSVEGFAAESAADLATASITVAKSTIAADIAEYSRKLEEYTAALQKYDDEVKGYWTAIADRRRARIAKRRNNEKIQIDDYVLAQPPVYLGPPKPVDPSAPIEEGPRPKKYVPVVADFLRAVEQEFNFVPQQPQRDIEYKRAYGKVASAAGLTKEQVVRIYAFESGGNGKYSAQSGIEEPTLDTQAISTALGYNQLLAANSVGLIAEKGDRFIETLNAKADGLTGEARQKLENKIAALKAMIDFSRIVPDEWSEHEKLAKTPKGLGIHAMNLDLDVGPLLQTQKLVDSVVFAQTMGYRKVLTAAELEMMNLTGDGNGIDIVMMPLEWRDKVPTSNFFRKGGYESNPIAIRNNVVSKLFEAINATMDEEIQLEGAAQLSALFRN